MSGSGGASTGTGSAPLRKTQVVVALDIGSAASRAMAFSETGEVLAQSQSEYQTYFPRPGCVEQDALEIWEAAQKALREVLSVLGADRVAAIGIANQRETTVLWNRSTGQPPLSCHCLAMSADGEPVSRIVCSFTSDQKQDRVGPGSLFLGHQN